MSNLLKKTKKQIPKPVILWLKKTQVWPIIGVKRHLLGKLNGTVLQELPEQES